jgi:hypothetical protein
MVLPEAVPVAQHDWIAASQTAVNGYGSGRRVGAGRVAWLAQADVAELQRRREASCTRILQRER